MSNGLIGGVGAVLGGLMMVSQATGSMAQETSGDAQKGEKVFKKCQSCHQIGEGAKNRTGPVLTGVIGRAAGSVDGFRYSKSMVQAGAAGLVWDEAQLLAYLAGPKPFLKAYLDDPKAKAKMTFRLKKEADRRDVIAYLGQFSVAAAGADSAAGEAEGTGGAGASTAAMTAGARDVCVRNATAARHFFVAEATGEGRESRWLEPGEMLCAKAASAGAHGVVSVFESEDSMEGCSWLTVSGEVKELRRYADFDRCEWGGNGN